MTLHKTFSTFIINLLSNYINTFVINTFARILPPIDYQIMLADFVIYLLKLY